MKTVLKQVYGESYILFNSQIIKWVAGIAVVVLSFLLKEAVDLQYHQEASYYTTQLLLSVIVIVVFFPILVGGFVGAKDYEWRTWGAKLLPMNRKRVVLIKLVVILAASVLITVISFLIGLFYDVVHSIPFSGTIFYQALATMYVCFFWGTVAFFIGVLTKNFALSAIIPFSYLFIEPFFYSKLSSALLVGLPYWNQRSFLHSIFDTSEGAIIIPDFNYNASWVGFGIFTAYLLVICCLLFFVVRRKQFE